MEAPDILASLAALRAKVMNRMDLKPRVALADSGNPGLSSSTPLVSSICALRAEEDFGSDFLNSDWLKLICSLFT